MSNGAPIRPVLLIVHPLSLRWTETCSLPIGVARTKIVNAALTDEVAAPEICVWPSADEAATSTAAADHTPARLE
jgi:hypothetical protein